MRHASAAVVLALAVPAAGCVDTAAPVPITPWASIAAGGTQSCGLDAEGAAWCWGSGWDGELGVAPTTETDRPLAVRTDERFTQIVTGYQHTCALSTEGTAFCWGWNVWGQLGTGHEDYALALATPVAGETTFTRLAAGWYHTCGLAEDGSILCWGMNRDGQVGDGTTAHRNVPTPIASDESFSAVAAGGFHSCALTAAGQPLCWGANAQGQLGNGTTEQRLTPGPVAGSTVYSYVAAGWEHTCAVTAARDLRCWGSNDAGELGNNLHSAPGTPGSLIPVTVPRPEPYVRVTAGRNYTCAVDTNGSGYCWGSGGYGQLGIGLTSDQLYPRAIETHYFTSIEASKATHTCGMGRSHGALCWGTAPRGQLGTTATHQSPVPIPVDRPVRP